MKLKTDYAGHDQLYQKRRAEGKPGWDDGEQWLAWKAEIEGLMADPAFPQSGSVLELGCGAGDVVLLFADRGYAVSGIDISPTAIEWAREKAESSPSTMLGVKKLKAEFAVGDVTDLGHWDDETFDVVIDGHCLHCIIGEDRKKVFAETYRVLKAGGLFYVNTMCGDPDEPEMAKSFDPKTRCMVVAGLARRYFGRPEDILEEIKSSGFKIERQEIRTGQGGQGDLIVMARK